MFNQKDPYIDGQSCIHSVCCLPLLGPSFERRQLFLFYFFTFNLYRARVVVVFSMFPGTLVLPKQVLISIQSLIFVAEPYFNEPGYEGQLGTPQVTIPTPFSTALYGCMYVH